jgi:nitroimidazol reductase NimA-like FMN-containing flavoprotein (pyridoxamine 5'-phosphate oxidase superfamily)
MPLLKLPKMNENEIKQALEDANICRIAFMDDVYPYISPFQYAYLNDTLYFHFTDYGKKKEILKKNKNVCVSIEHLEEDLSAFYFISMQGKLVQVDNEQEKSQVLKQMVKNARKIYSQNFLSAHGFEKGNEWDILAKENQILYKFIQMREPIGLKSP